MLGILAWTYIRIAPGHRPTTFHYVSSRYQFLTVYSYNAKGNSVFRISLSPFDNGCATAKPVVTGSAIDNNDEITGLEFFWPVDRLPHPQV